MAAAAVVGMVAGAVVAIVAVVTAAAAEVEAVGDAEATYKLLFPEHARKESLPAVPDPAPS